MTSALAQYARQTKIQELEDFCAKSAVPVGETEEARCERAERMIRSAIDAYQYFPAEVKSGIKIFAQGSYRNGTNITTDSDVDVAVCCTSSFFTDYTQAGYLGDAYFGNVPAAYTFQQFRIDVTKAIQTAFGAGAVTIGNKALRIDGNSGRIGADVVPVFEFRQYQPNGEYWSGTRFITNDGKIVTNWPHQHYYFGVDKNKATGYRYKKVVRVLKTIRRDLSGTAAKTPSFLIESMVWNAPDQCFNGTSTHAAHSALSAMLFQPSLLDNAQAVLWWLSTQCNPANMREVNMIKPLFSTEQAWTIADANSFVYQAGQKLGCWA